MQLPCYWFFDPYQARPDSADFGISSLYCHNQVEEDIHLRQLDDETYEEMLMRIFSKIYDLNKVFVN